MKLRIARLGVLFAGIMGLLGVMTPPAHAVKFYTISFVGTASYSGGLGNPCTPPGTMNDCPPSTTTTTKPKPNDKPGFQVNYTFNGGNVRGFAFSEIEGMCVAEGATVNKKPVIEKLPLEAGVCDIFASGVVTGYCDPSTGVAFGSATIHNGILPDQDFTFTLKFTGLGGKFLIQGRVTKSGHPTDGNLSAIATGVPDPLAGSCTNKTLTRYIIQGDAQFQFKNGLL